MTRYTDIHLADGTRRVVAVTAKGEYIASCVYGRGYPRKMAAALLREVVKECGESPSTHPPEWFTRVQRLKVKDVELTLAEPVFVYGLPVGTLVETDAGLGRVVASGLGPSGAGKVTVSPRTKSARRYR